MTRLKVRRVRVLPRVLLDQVHQAPAQLHGLDPCAGRAPAPTGPSTRRRSPRPGHLVAVRRNLDLGHMDLLHEAVDGRTGYSSRAGSRAWAAGPALDVSDRFSSG